MSGIDTFILDILEAFKYILLSYGPATSFDNQTNTGFRIIFILFSRCCPDSNLEHFQYDTNTGPSILT